MNEKVLTSIRMLTDDEREKKALLLEKYLQETRDDLKKLLSQKSRISANIEALNEKRTYLTEALRGLRGDF